MRQPERKRHRLASASRSASPLAKPSEVTLRPLLLSVHPIKLCHEVLQYAKAQGCLEGHVLMVAWQVLCKNRNLLWGYGALLSAPDTDYPNCRFRKD